MSCECHVTFLIWSCECHVTLCRPVEGLYHKSMPQSVAHYCCHGNCTHCTQAANQVKALYNLFTKVDATQVEINPFGETPDGKGTPLPLIPHRISSSILYNRSLLILFSPQILFSSLFSSSPLCCSHSPHPQWCVSMQRSTLTTMPSFVNARSSLKRTLQRVTLVRWKQHNMASTTSAWMATLAA